MDAELDRGVPIDPELGTGELGKGFYAFIGTGEYGEAGIEKAKKQARARSASRAGSQPCLIYVTIRTDTFLELSKIEVTLANAEDYVTPKCPKGRNASRQVPILWGPLFHNGLQLLWDQPRQYKFEEGASEHLTVVQRVPL
jgi:hypothetical protein